MSIIFFKLYILPLANYGRHDVSARVYSRRYRNLRKQIEFNPIPNLEFAGVFANIIDDNKIDDPHQKWVTA